MAARPFTTRTSDSWFLDRLIEGSTPAQIGALLGVQSNWVNKRLRGIMLKSGCATREQLAAQHAVERMTAALQQDGEPA